MPFVSSNQQCQSTERNSQHYSNQCLMALSFLHLITGLLNELRRCSVYAAWLSDVMYVQVTDGRTDIHRAIAIVQR